jgi:flagellin-specific chaperone FliS
MSFVSRVKEDSTKGHEEDNDNRHSGHGQSKFELVSDINHDVRVIQEYWNLSEDEKEYSNDKVRFQSAVTRLLMSLGRKSHSQLAKKMKTLLDGVIHTLENMAKNESDDNEKINISNVLGNVKKMYDKIFKSSVY